MTPPRVSVSRDRESLLLQGALGEVETFPSVWLRDSSSHPDTTDPVSLGRTLLMEDLDTDVKISKVNFPGLIFTLN